MTAKRLYLLFAHPAFHRSRINRILVDAVRDLPGVTFQDLYETYPDFNIAVADEQAALRDHDIIIFHHPFYWYSAPSLLKEWQDLVLEYGFAYGDEGSALQGKQLLSVITTGGGQGAYQPEGINRYHMCQLLTPFEQTASFCGMTYLPPFIVHGVLQEDEDRFRLAATQYRACLEALRDGSVDASAAERGAYLTDVVTLAGSEPDAR